MNLDTPFLIDKLTEILNLLKEDKLGDEELDRLRAMLIDREISKTDSESEILKYFTLGWYIYSSLPKAD